MTWRPNFLLCRRICPVSWDWSPQRSLAFSLSYRASLQLLRSLSEGVVVRRPEAVSHRRALATLDSVRQSSAGGVTAT